jgi:hypothetical protein
VHDEILKRLDALAAKLGVTGNHVWTILVKQARVEAAKDLIFALIAVGALAGCIKGFRLLWKRSRALKNDASTGLNDDGEGFGAICLALIGTFALMVAVHYSMATVTELINPEYFALQQIINAN